MMEAWSVVDGGLVADGTVKDVCLYLKIQKYRPNIIAADLVRIAGGVQQGCRFVCALGSHGSPWRNSQAYCGPPGAGPISGTIREAAGEP